MQRYDIRRGRQKNIQEDGLRAIASECFGEAQGAGGKVVCRYGALAQLQAWTNGQVLYVDTDMRKDVPDEVARSTIRAYDVFPGAGQGIHGQGASQEGPGAREGRPLRPQVLNPWFP